MDRSPKIKMRVNGDEGSTCISCKAIWKNTAEMYDVKLGSEVITLCKACVDELFRKTLRAQTIYNSRLKSQKDLKRAANEHLAKNGKIGNKPSTVLNEIKGEQNGEQRDDNGRVKKGKRST